MVSYSPMLHNPLPQPPSDLGLIVIIPSLNEPHLKQTFESLWTCRRTEVACEVIIVINHSQNASLEIQTNNEKSYHETLKWIQSHKDNKLRFYPLFCPDLPVKQAGVGLARKIGMDLAYERFKKIDALEGVIACVDADCTVSDNYLEALVNHFKQNEKTQGCAVYFEHTLENLDSQTREGIIQYELFLRYLVQALRFSGHPYAYHTVGSSMAVRAKSYHDQGGMNTRQAAEDFHFLQKFIELGKFSNLTKTTVFPSARISDRVPFGTGKAMTDWKIEEKQSLQSYSFQTFLDLKEWIQKIPELYKLEITLLPAWIQTLPESVQKFLNTFDFEITLRSIQENTSSQNTFVKRFFRWFNALQTLHFIHFAQTIYPNTSILIAANELLKALGQTLKRENSETLLQILRTLDRQNTNTRKKELCLATS